MFYNIVLVSGIRQHKSAIGMHMSPPTWTSFPPHSPPLDCHRALGWTPRVICNFPFSSVQSLSRVLLFVTPWIAAHQASLSITNSWSTHKLMSIESVIPSSHLILLSPFPPAPNPSKHQSLFQWVSSSHQMAKVLEFQPQHQSFQWTSKRTDLL